MQAPRRIAAIDIARTIAIVAMAVFHFTYDLEVFGFLPIGTLGQPGWVWFARIIAGSFIFLSGISLVLAYQSGPVSPRKYLTRLAMIGAGALAVSIGTYIAMGSAFVRFGILHHMFVASLLGLLCLRCRWWLNMLLGGAILALPHVLTWPALLSVNWLWLARTIEPMPPSVDYVPVLPWFGLYLLGMALARLLLNRGAWHGVARAMNPDAPMVRALSWPGKHTLSIYLLHQPILFGVVMGARLMMT